VTTNLATTALTMAASTAAIAPAKAAMAANVAGANSQFLNKWQHCAYASLDIAPPSRFCEPAAVSRVSEVAPSESMAIIRGIAPLVASGLNIDKPHWRPCPSCPACLKACTPRLPKKTSHPARSADDCAR
jgi:hypothetical protein